MEIITDISNIELHYNTEITLKCAHCQSLFVRWWKFVKSAIKLNRAMNYCSNTCASAHRKSGKSLFCSQCNKIVYCVPSHHRKNKSNRVFCSQSCAATYNNTHKTHGHRRSKSEVFLENQLIKLYPNLEIHFNRKDAINSELDIYIPSLKLAFELNGIFHYEPIYGQEKLNRIQNNDSRRFQACLEKGIELCILDTSGISYFKEERMKPFLDIVCRIINQKLN